MSQRFATRAGWRTSGAAMVASCFHRTRTSFARWALTGFFALAAGFVPIQSAQATLSCADYTPDPLTTITSPASGSVYGPAPQNITLSASTSPGTIQKVDYFSNGQLIASVTSGSPWSFAWNNVPAGTYSITAQATQWTVGCTGVGELSSPVSVTVTANNAALVSQSVPATMVEGQTYSVTVVMQNTGTSTWTPAGNYKLGSDGTWGTSRALVNTPVAPGQQYAFTFSVTAPSTPGNYTFNWQMVQEGVQWFGDHTNVSVTVPQPYAASVVSQSVPSTMVAGLSYTATVVVQNTGSNTWTAANNYKLGSQNPHDNTTWGTSRVLLNSSASVAMGQQYTFSIPFTAPSTPGTYNFQWQMLQEGVQWFGGVTPNVAVNVTMNPNWLIVPPPTSSGSGIVGRTPGQLSVSKVGQANYTIPIPVPPGTNNMVPQLALQYTGGAGNGAMGVGWNWAGLSQITRCPRDVVHDQQAAAVDLSSNDAFCIDGQRMLVVNGTYGAAGSEYRAEIHNFTKILASSILAGSGPASFTATDRNGVKYEYGTVSTAQLLLPGEPTGTPVTWALNKVTDPRGNYYTITYTSAASNTGQQLVSRIDYTGNANAALATYNSVQFVYDTARSDVEWQYLAGYKIVQTMRLNQIQTYNGTTLVKNYSLAYQTSAPTARSRLASITECSGSSGPCLPATTFTWEDTPVSTFGTSITYPDPGTEFPGFYSPGPGAWDPGQSYWVDLNGDGRTDHCRASKHIYSDPPTVYDYEVMFCGITQPNGSVNVVSFGHFQPSANYQFVDVNGDGILDVCEDAEVASGTCWLMGPSGPTGTQTGGYIPLGSHGNFVQYVDVNGDGIIDYCRVNTLGDLSCALGTGGGNFGAVASLGTFVMPSCMNFSYAKCTQQQFSWANLSGDGVMWFCRIDTGAMRCRKWTPSGLGPEIATPAGTDLGLTGPNVGTAWADVNGDGKDDFCRVLSDGTNRVACTLSTGTGFGDTIYSSAIDTGSKGLWIDVNGDGKADFCRLAASASTTACLLSTGSGFGSAVSYPVPVQAPDAYQYVRAPAGLVDANSDGKVDACNAGQCVTASGKASDYLLSVTDGLGATSGVDYGNLSDSTIYTKGSGAVFPIEDLQNTTFVVTQLRLPNGTGGTMATSYKYESFKTHVQGRGSLGYGAITPTDPQGTSTRTEFRQDFPYLGLASHAVVSNGGAMLSDTAQSYGATAGPAYTIQPTLTVAKTYDLNGAFINWVETTNSNFDTYNNPQQIAVVYKDSSGVTDGFSSTMALSYQNDTTDWCLGLPTSKAETRAMTGVANSTRTSTYSYFASNPGLCLVQQKIDEPTNGGLGVTNLQLTTAYAYDSFGNLTTRTVSGANIATRTEVTNTYDPQGRFATTVKNALNQAETRSFDPGLGGMLTSTDANNLTTTWTYDAFGRIATMRRPDGTQLTYSRNPCVNCVNFSSYVTYRTDTVTATGATASPYLRVYSDTLDREVFNAQPGFNGADVYVQSNYDSLARLQSRSKPFYNTDSAIRLTQYYYDSLGRVNQVKTPDGNTGTAVATTTTTYNGRTRTVTNNNNVSFAKTINSQGTVVSVVDAQGAAEQSAVSYQYDQWKNLTTTTDAVGNNTTITYDLRGRKTQILDPDMGTRNYIVDNLGEVTSSVDSKNQTTTFTWDVLGRMTGRTEADLSSNWYYESDSTGVACANGVGRLCQVLATNGYSRRYSYDSVSRLSSETTSVDTGYTGSRTYDAAGRIATVTYPASTGTPLGITYNYNSQGMLQSITDSSAGTAYWTKNSDNSDANLGQETYGNGLIGTRGYDFNTGRLNSIKAGPSGSPASIENQSYGYDSLGRMTSRSDTTLATSETFTYDALNRLYSTVLTAPGVSGGSQSSSFTYDALGNITSKSGVGTYSYTAGKPHAVSGVNGTVNGVSMPAYTYDANGNMQTDGTRSFTWTSFNMPLVISKTATTGSPGSGSASFNYGAEHQRVKQAWTSGSQASTTIYLDEFDFEKVTDSTGTTYKHYIKADGRIVADVIRSPSSNSVLYLVPDHLGSTTTVMDATGNVVDRQAYDPWGDRRFASGSIGAPDPTNTIQPTSINRGYTGHEMLDQGNLGLVHMNGRVYDPTLARFISADPTVQQPYATQSLNRYAYVLNDPLDLTDPSGYEPLDPGRFSDAQQIELQRVEVTGTGWSPPIIFSMGTAVQTIRFGSASAEASALVRGGALLATRVPQVAAVAGVGYLTYTYTTMAMNSQTGQAALMGSLDWMLAKTADGKAVEALNAGSDATTGNPDPNDGKDGKKSKGKSVNQINKDVKTDKAPDGIKRADTGKVEGEQDHVHFDNGNALNRDGTWKHVKSSEGLTRAQERYLVNAGWTLPK